MVLKNLQKPKGDNDEVDKISKLPDTLIHHIYSFLPTKCVLSTCILSKRWRDLSNSVPILYFREWRTNFEEDYALAVKKIMNFVDTVLFVHEKPKIKKFLLNVSDCFDETRVNRWIRTIITRKVEELVLYVPYDEKPFIFPLSFFTCDSLIMLDLEYHGILNLPKTISFPKLKILRLANIVFVNENLTRELFSNCPILEELSLADCQFQDLKVLRITSLALKHLYIIDGNLLGSKLKILAPNLLTIKYATDTPADLVLGSFSFSSLVEANIQIYDNWNHEKTHVSYIDLYKMLSNVKLLKMSGSSFQVCLINYFSIFSLLAD
ncbi:hypothetical protein MKX03_028204 [Papaver bracteatum]|nr:hypothetical protein MKX03_028204 [Papaver bracteatum]